jgi:hypothetical protein
MGLETGNFIDNLDRDWPLSSDNVSEGDNHLQLIKRALQYTFPLGTDTTSTSDVGPDQAVQVLIAKATEPTIDTSASGHAARAMGMLWLDTSAGAGLAVLKMRNQANDAWVEFAVSAETNKSVDINAGTIDGATIGASSASTAVVSSLNVNADGATVTGIKNEDDLASDSDTKLATQGSIKAYVDAQVTAQDLDIISDSGNIDIDLDGDSLTVTGGEGIDTSAVGTTLTITGEEASTSNKGVASFSSDHFSVSSGAVTIATDGIDDTLIDFGTGTNQVSTADVPEQTNLYYTNVRADARIAAADIGDLSNVDITSIANDEVLRYDSTSGTWENVASEYPDQLTTKGDLVAYNSGSDPAAEERFPMPGGSASDNKVLTANDSAEFGFNWVKVDTASIEDDAVGASQLANTSVTANTYAYPSAIVVDAQGRLTSATAGTAGATAGFSVAMAIAL